MCVLWWWWCVCAVVEVGALARKPLTTPAFTLIGAIVIIAPPYVTTGAREPSVCGPSLVVGASLQRLQWGPLAVESVVLMDDGMHHVYMHCALTNGQSPGCKYVRWVHMCLLMHRLHMCCIGNV